MLVGAEARATPRYFSTLNVENCGAIGIPMTRRAPAAASSSSASAMKGRQLRMPNATGTLAPNRSASAFVCDHTEILFDVDVQAAATARGCGAALRRTESLNTSPTFIGALEDIVRRRL